MGFSIRKFRQIIEGFTNYTFSSETIEEMAKVRAKKCASCQEANPKFIFQKFKDNVLTDIEGMGCNLCRCLLSAKVRSVMEKCPHPDKKW